MRRSASGWPGWCGGYAGLVPLGSIHFRYRPGRVALLLALFFTPFAGEWLVSLRRPIFYDRTLIWASIPLYLLLAAGIRQLHRWSYILVVVSLVLTVNGLSLREYCVDEELDLLDRWRFYGLQVYLLVYSD